MSDDAQAGNTEFDDAFEDAVSGVDQSSEGVPDEPTQNDQTEPAEKTTDDIIAEIERERDSWKHQFQSNNGRISSYQKQIQELTEKLQERANSNSQESLTEAMEDEDWIALKEDFPEMAAAVEKRLQVELDNRLNQALSQKMSAIEGRLRPIEEINQQSRRMQEYAALEAAHPDYVDVVRSNEFKQWVQNQPQPVQQLYHSEAASDAAYLLSSYKAMARSVSPSRDIQQERRARLASNVSAPARRVSRQPIADDDFDSAWEAATAKR